MSYQCIYQSGGLCLDMTCVVKLHEQKEKHTLINLNMIMQKHHSVIICH